MKNKFIKPQEASQYYFDGMTLMFGGFMGVGTPPRLVKSILDSNVKNLTIIGNDTGMIGKGISPLIENNCVKKVVASHIGTNPETGRKMIAGEMEVELVPQGTLAERVRSGGSGLGGFLTPTGLGTIVEEGKQKMMINGKEFLLELPLYADVAIIKAHKVDRLGNATYKFSARNFNPLIALAAKTVIVEADEIVEVGDIAPNDVMTPTALVDHILFNE